MKIVKYSKRAVVLEIIGLDITTEFLISQFVFIFQSSWSLWSSVVSRTWSSVLKSRMSRQASWSRQRCSSVLGWTTLGSVSSSSSSGLNASAHTEGKTQLLIRTLVWQRKLYRCCNVCQWFNSILTILHPEIKATLKTDPYFNLIWTKGSLQQDLGMSRKEI